MASTIGGTLRHAREQKGISFDEVHSKIKIHPRILQLLEEEKFDKLPSPLFAKSFLKSYAEFLALNPADLLQQYDREARKEPDQVLFIKPAELREKEKKSLKNLIPVFAGAAVLAAVAGVLFFLFAVVLPWIGKGISGLMNRPPAAKVERQSKPEGPSQPAAASSEWLRSVDQKNFPKIAKDTPLSLKIKATNTVWLKVTCDGKVLFESTMMKGISDVWTANESIEIWTGNSANMDLTLNNHRLGSVGKGVVKRMVIDRRGVRIVPKS